MEMVQWVTPYFGEAVVFEEEAAKKFLSAAIAPVLTKLTDRFESLPTFDKPTWEATFKQFVEAEGLKMGQIAQPVRVALTGRTASPGLRGNGGAGAGTYFDGFAGASSGQPEPNDVVRESASILTGTEALILL
ncbi:MAG: hypothetical protein U0361_16290 [Nitrospiraceae bacterium]